MALKDSLKHFKDFDGYSGNLSKSDMDNNLDLLANEIDKKANNEDVIFTAGDTSIHPKDEHIDKPLSVLSVKFSESSVIAHNQIITDYFAVNNTGAFVLANNFAIVNYAEQNSFVKLIKKITTSDDTKTYLPPTYFSNFIILKIKCFALSEDFSEKYAFERVICAHKNSDGNAVIDYDNTNEFISNSDLSFDVETDGNQLKFAVTGKVDTNITWRIFFEVNGL